MSFKTHVWEGILISQVGNWVLTFLQVNVEGLVLVAGPGVGECLQDTSAPVRLAAERCALHLFQLTRGEVCFAHYAILFIVVVLFNIGVSALYWIL